jgi:glycosyltransferase involved in cell wall biosynthesis
MSVFNDAERVGSAVKSVLSQTFHDIELVVVDDGSTDGSGEILEELAGSDARIRVIRQPNVGLTRALIRGCEASRGQFVARQDSDDWSHPKRIEEQLALIEADPEIGFVSCATQYVGPLGEPLMVISRSADSATATRALLDSRQGPPAHGSVLFRRSLYDRVGGYRTQFHYAQDADLWLRMAEAARVAFLPEVRYVALREADSASGKMRPLQRQFGEIAELCHRTRAQCGDEGDLLARAGALSESIRSGGSVGHASRLAHADASYFIGAQLAKNRDPRARRYLLKTLSLRPWHWKAWIRLVQSALFRSMPEVGS